MRRGGSRQGGGPYTVADAVADYLRFLESDGRSKQAIQDARYRIDAFIVPRLGAIKIAALSAEHLRRWRRRDRQRRGAAADAGRGDTKTFDRQRRCGRGGHPQIALGLFCARAQSRFPRRKSQIRSGMAKGKAVPLG